MKRIKGYHKDMAKQLRGMTVRRGEYDEILFWRAMSDEHVKTLRAAGQPDTITANSMLRFFAECLPSTYVSFDRRARGDAVNVDLYAYDPTEGVAIVQARHAFRRRANGYLNVHKTYFLAGFNELTRAPFRHPVSANTVRAAVRKHGWDQAAIVRACQCWMWSVTPKQLAASVRQGDVLLTPVRGEPAGEPLGTMATLDSHVVEAAEVRRNGVLYARDLTIRHEKAQHREVMAEGWNRITLARAAASWNFAARLGD